MSIKQLLLDLGHRPALDRSNLFVTAGNQDAISWVDQWPNWKGHALAVHGPEGCGKTHLAHVFASRANALLLCDADMVSIDPVALAHRYSAIILDRTDGPIHEQNLFHLFNAIREAQGHFLISSREAPARWLVELPDLRSRLKSITATKISAPDDATLITVLAKLFKDRQILIAVDVLEYAIVRMPRTFSASATLVDLVDRESLAQGRRVTVPLIREVLNSSNFAEEII